MNTDPVHIIVSENGDEKIFTLTLVLRWAVAPPMGFIHTLSLQSTAGISARSSIRG